MSAEHIWALVSGLPSGKRERRLLLMLQAYVDESYGGNPGIYVMAGFVSTAERWAAFSDQWQRALEAKPSIRRFKMSEAMTLHGEFAGWRPELRDEKLRLLTEAIADHAILAIGAAVHHKTYKEVFKDEALPRPLWRPYFFLLHGIIARLAQAQHEYGLTEKIDFIFDEQVHEKHAIIRNWEHFLQAKVAPAHLLGDIPSFKSDETCLPLQAADLHAWWFRDTARRQLAGEPFRPLPSTPGKKNPEALLFIWTDEQLRAIRRELENREWYRYRPRMSASFPAWDPKWVPIWDGRPS